MYAPVVTWLEYCRYGINQNQSINQHVCASCLCVSTVHQYNSIILSVAETHIFGLIMSTCEIIMLTCDFYIILLYVDICKSHVNMIMLHVDINNYVEC